MAIKAFISRTFRGDEREQSAAAIHFTNLAKEVGLEAVVVSPKGGRKVPEHVLGELRQCVVAIGMFTKRNKIEGKNYWTVPPSIIFEMGIARALGLTIAGFIQKGVSREELGLVGMEGWQIPEFDPKTMYQPREVEKFKSYLSTLVPKTQEFAGTYRIVKLSKQVEVFPDGYATVTHTCRLLVQSVSFRKATHMFGLGPNAGKDVKLPSFIDMSEVSPRTFLDRLPYFSFRILDPKSSELGELSLQVIPTASCNEEQIEFDVVLQGQPTTDLIINYEWSVGCFDMFPVNKASLSRGERKEEMDFCFSSFFLGHGGIEDFNFQIVFHRPYEFDKPPSLKVYDQAGNPTLMGGSFDIQKGATRDTFSSTNMNFSHLAAGRVVAEWVPK